MTPRTFFLASHLISSHLISHFYLPCISHTHAMHIVASHLLPTERNGTRTRTIHLYIITHTLDMRRRFWTDGWTADGRFSAVVLAIVS
ncbi:hypothetical protein B0H14DRAFT_1242009 [Mycena olivaceomarginata]|nr:hypothetical protein B0H14DRAFT_1242009 [Mycena olivaceomarginata]